MNAISSQNFGFVLQNPAEWGRLSESAVGSHLLNYASQQNFNLYYWREGNTEVDFILELNNQLIAIEVKTGHRVNKTGINSFTQKFRPRFAIIVGTEGIPLEDFLKMNPIELFRFK
jgi:predicted AAA+ superfamily ATPase